MGFSGQVPAKGEVVPVPGSAPCFDAYCVLAVALSECQLYSRVPL